MIEKSIVRRKEEIGKEKEIVGVLELLIDIDMRGKVVIGVILIENRKRGEMRIKKVIIVIGVKKKGEERIGIEELGKEEEEIIENDNGSEGIMENGKKEEGWDIGVIKKVVGEEEVIVGWLGIMKNIWKMLKMEGEKKMVDIGKGWLWKKEKKLRVKSKELMKIESVKRKIIRSKFEIRGVVLEKREKIGGDWLWNSGK